jgi:hypothetical protein
LISMLLTSVSPIGYTFIVALVAQWIEHLSSEQRASGSNPFGCISKYFFCDLA